MWPHEIFWSRHFQLTGGFAVFKLDSFFFRFNLKPPIEANHAGDRTIQAERLRPARDFSGQKRIRGGDIPF
jgi:hypothetical protein